MCHSNSCAPRLADCEFAVCLQLGSPAGAIDMRLHAEDEEYVFLEINPAGQFLFTEERTEQPIAKALANLLVAQHKSDQSCPTASR